MSTILAPALHKLSIEEYHRLGAAGVLAPESRVELIDGDLFDMAPIGSLHASVVSQLSMFFVTAVGKRAFVWAQNPLHLPPRSEPQPDIVLLRPRTDAYRAHLPIASDVLLLVEVSDASLRFDRSVKLGLYARSGIRETWILNLADRVLEVYREPRGDIYLARSDHYAADRVAPAALSDAAVDLGPLLDPSS